MTNTWHSYQLKELFTLYYEFFATVFFVSVKIFKNQKSFLPSPNHLLSPQRKFYVGRQNGRSMKCHVDEITGHHLNGCNAIPRRNCLSKLFLDLIKNGILIFFVKFLLKKLFDKKFLTWAQCFNSYTLVVYTFLRIS